MYFLTVSLNKQRTIRSMKNGFAFKIPSVNFIKRIESGFNGTQLHFMNDFMT